MMEKSTWLEACQPRSTMIYYSMIVKFLVSEEMIRLHSSSKSKP